MPRFTVITPSYNQAAYIGATIASVLTQDLTDFEYRIIDGGSTDGTVALLRAQTDPRLTWVSEKDRGQANAINKGMMTAQGDLLTFINSDDVLLPGALRCAADYFAAHPDTDLIYGDSEFIDAAGAHLSVFFSEEFDVHDLLVGGQEFTQPGMAWRRRMSARIGAFDERLHYQFDREFCLRAALAGASLDYVPGIRAQYRLHEHSKTVSQADRFLDDWRAVTHEVFRRTDLPDGVRALQRDVEAYFVWHDAKRDWAKGDYPAARPRLWRTLRGGRASRRVLAAAMLLDSYAGTRLAPAVARLFTRVTGKPVELLSSVE
ncbi:MAG: glycosyltransferase family 2 protein [Chloroflexota bacterium]|nr:glycosyltransferase family 2 protein [Chloroflexota bacterium]